MATKPKYRLALQIMFSTEDALEIAIAVFNAWCRTKLPPKNTKHPVKRDKNEIKNGYGFIRTKNHSGELFLISDEYFEGWKLFLLIRDLKVDGLVSVGSSSCSEIVANPEPAS